MDIYFCYELYFFTSLNSLLGGQKSRVAFAKITFKKPHIILLDEPSNHLVRCYVSPLFVASWWASGPIATSLLSYLLQGKYMCLLNLCFCFLSWLCLFSLLKWYANNLCEEKIAEGGPMIVSIKLLT